MVCGCLQASLPTYQWRLLLVRAACGTLMCSWQHCMHGGHHPLLQLASDAEGGAVLQGWGLTPTLVSAPGSCLCLVVPPMGRRGVKGGQRSLWPGLRATQHALVAQPSWLAAGAPCMHIAS